MAATSAATPDAHRRALLTRRIRLFVAATITYNVLEAIVAITAGAAASSTALVGFGLDSIIEVTSAAAVAWQFAGKDPQAREQTALRVIAWSFFALAGYVSIDAVIALAGGNEARHSTVGLILAAVSLGLMPLLSYGQQRAGRQLNSRSAVADSKQTLLCTYLSAVLLIGLVLNSLFGWTWADPVAALVIAVVAVREGRDAWKGDACCAPGTGLDHHDDEAASAGCNDGCDCCRPTAALTNVGPVINQGKNLPGTPIEVWDTDEPSERGIDGMERMGLVRDDIAARVDALATQMRNQDDPAN